MLPDLCIGLTRLCFQISGTSPVEMDKLKIYVSGPDKALSPAFIILTLIPSILTEREAKKEAIFYFGDRFCYVNESRALELYAHSLTQLIYFL